MLLHKISVREEIKTFMYIVHKGFDWVR